MLSDAETGTAHFERSDQSTPKASIAIDLQGRITRVSAAQATFLGSHRHLLIGKEFGQIFNDQTLSTTDLSKLRRACSWAQTGKVPVATVITYLSRFRSPYLLDALVQPTLVDGQVSGVYLFVRDISRPSNFHFWH
jgi:PAS domain S-box-containing protein